MTYDFVNSACASNVGTLSNSHNPRMAHVNDAMGALTGSGSSGGVVGSIHSFFTSAGGVGVCDTNCLPASAWSWNTATSGGSCTGNSGESWDTVTTSDQIRYSHMRDIRTAINNMRTTANYCPCTCFYTAYCNCDSEFLWCHCFGNKSWGTWGRVAIARADILCDAFGGGNPSCDPNCGCNRETSKDVLLSVPFDSANTYCSVNCTVYGGVTTSNKVRIVNINELRKRINDYASAPNDKRYPNTSPPSGCGDMTWASATYVIGGCGVTTF